MLRDIINDDEIFFEALRTYLDEFKNGTATDEDFKKVLARETDRNLDSFFEEWDMVRDIPFSILTVRE